MTGRVTLGGAPLANRTRVEPAVRCAFLSQQDALAFSSTVEQGVATGRMGRRVREGRGALLSGLLRFPSGQRVACEVSLTYFIALIIGDGSRAEVQ